MPDCSGLGGTAVMTVFAILTVGYLLLVAAPLTAALVAIAAASGSLLVSILKDSFGRVRPDESFAAAYSAGPSFPSGHVSISALVFLVLGVLVASTRAKRSERTCLVFCAALLAALVGISRIGLGVQWVTDVLGGWTFGTAWALLWLLLSRLLTRCTTGWRAHPIVNG
jgi:undecaprenyl-diphosphatase